MASWSVALGHIKKQARLPKTEDAYIMLWFDLIYITTFPLNFTQYIYFFFYCGLEVGMTFKSAAIHSLVTFEGGYNLNGCSRTVT